MAIQVHEVVAITIIRKEQEQLLFIRVATLIHTRNWDRIKNGLTKFYVPATRVQNFHQLMGFPYIYEEKKIQVTE